MDVVDLLNRLGGVGDTRVLVEATSRAALEAAVRDGSVLHVGRGKYALPTAYQAHREAARLSGVNTERLEVMKKIRTSAAPSAHDGSSKSVVSCCSAGDSAARWARSSSDSSSVDCSCIRTVK